ncbi:GPW/gp25 family protein [Azohydromonas aeria]|uniref:GPW/gp25 family protein n=1 Tax=Azohydromonas aeria TaxID=2590212 RepID=UPI0012F79BA2|nr:hypothetical protein [Azohydromonas aeria]
MPRDDRALFGTDLALLDVGGAADLTMLGHAGASGDLALAVGNANAVQALTMRLRVRQGELAALGWPDYGSRLHELIGEPDVARTRLKAQVFARDAVQADPRVLKVEQVEVTSIPGERSVLRLALLVTLIDAPQPLNLVFPFALDGAAVEAQRS